jgi:hypothetical protein
LAVVVHGLASGLTRFARLLVGDHRTIGDDAAAAGSLAACGAVGVGPGAGLPTAASVDAALAADLEPWLELILRADQKPAEIAEELLLARALAAEHPGLPWHLAPADAEVGGFAIARWVAVARLALGSSVVLLIDPVAARPKLAQLAVTVGADGWSRIELDTEAAKRPLQERADRPTCDRLLAEVQSGIAAAKC